MIDANSDESTESRRGAGSEKRRKILDGAKRIFFSEGFDGASMDSIARAAGVSKGTLYVYFKNKDALFEALIADLRGSQPENLFAIDEGGNLEKSLFHVAHNFIDMILRPEHMALIRTVVGAVEKFPHVGAMFYDAGAGRGQERLAVLFQRHMADGRLIDEDPAVAARHFIDLTVTGIVRKVMMCGSLTMRGPEIDAHIRRGIAVFLRAYACGGVPQPR